MAKPITIKITGDASGFTKALSGVETKLSSFGKVAGTALVATGAAAVAGVGLAATALFKIGSTFDEASDKIAVGTGATGEALAGLEQDFKNIATRIPGDMGQAADAVAILNTNLGASGKELQDLGTNVLEASRLLGEDGVANAESFSRSLNTFGIPAANGTESLDALFLATQKYGVSLGDLSGQLSTYGPVLNNANFSMEESAAFFGQLQKGGIAVSRVMPGLNKAFRTWASEGKNSREELEKVVEQIKNTEDGAEALSLATEVFGAEGAQRMTTAIRENIISLEDLDTALADSTGVIGDTAAETDSLGEKFGRFKNKVFVALEPIATKLFDSLGDAFEKAAPHIESFMKDAARWIEQYGVPAFRKIIEWAGKVVTWIKANWPAISKVLTTVFAAAKEVLKGLWQAIQDYVVPAAEQIIEWLGLAVAWVQENWPAISEKFTEIWGVIEEVIGFIVGAIEWFVERFQTATDDGEESGANLSETFENLRKAITAAMEAIQVVVETAIAVITWVWDNFGDEITIIVDTMVEIVVGRINGLLQILTGIFNLIKSVLTGKWGEAWDAIKEIANGLWDFLSSPIIAIVDGITDIFGDLFETVTKPFKEAFNAAKDWLSDTFKGTLSRAVEAVGKVIPDGLKKGMKSVIGFAGDVASAVKTAVKNAWNAIADKVNEFIPNSVGWGPFTLDIPDNPIPKFAMGGVAPGGMVTVGERGPENVFLPRGARVVPNHASSAGGSNINVNVQTNADPWEVGREVAWTMKTAGV